MSEDTAYNLMCKIHAVNKVFKKACSQVILLNHQIEAVKARYDRTRVPGTRVIKQPSFRYTQRFIRLGTLEGVRNLIYTYACEKCEEIEDLQSKLMNLPDDDDDDDDDQIEMEDVGLTDE